MDMTTMGSMIASLRKEKGLTQLELAQMMNVTDKAVSKWERDLSCPDIASLPKLAEILGRSRHRDARHEVRGARHGRCGRGDLHHGEDGGGIRIDDARHRTCLHRHPAVWQGGVSPHPLRTRSSALLTISCCQARSSSCSFMSRPLMSTIVLMTGSVRDLLSQRYPAGRSSLS